MSAQRQDEVIYDAFKARCSALMENVAGTFRKRGYGVSEVQDISCDEYQWEFSVEREGERPVSVILTLHEEAAYEGEGGGCNWSLQGIEDGGRISFDLSPFNWTEKCWVPMDDIDAVGERLAVIEGVAGDAVVDYMEAA